jgi:hypothetical protein
MKPLKATFWAFICTLKVLQNNMLKIPAFTKNDRGCRTIRLNANKNKKSFFIRTKKLNLLLFKFSLLYNSN